MAVSFGAVHPDPASKGGLIYTAKLLASGRLLGTAGFEKPPVIPIHHRFRERPRRLAGRSFVGRFNRSTNPLDCYRRFDTEGVVNRACVSGRLQLATLPVVKQPRNLHDHCHVRDPAGRVRHFF